MQHEKKISPYYRKRLDRQRFIGLETQRKILITPLNGPNTELAKNLILAGVNVTIYDEHTVSMDDFYANFLIGLNYIGKNRGEVIFYRLKQMNPNGNNQLENKIINIDDLPEGFFKPYTIVCTSFTDFKVMYKWDCLTKKAGIPYYNIVSAGPYAFCFVSLGNTYTYSEPTTKQNSKTYKIDCLSFAECLDRYYVKKSRKKYMNILQCAIMIKYSQEKGLSYDAFDYASTYEYMLYCMIDLGEDIKEEGISRDLLLKFAKFYGIEYCPVYSIIGSIVSQEIIKVVENQQEPAMNWIVTNSVDGYSCVLKLKKQYGKITNVPIYDTLNDGC